jgi:hypothetical protein
VCHDMHRHAAPYPLRHRRIVNSPAFTVTSHHTKLSISSRSSLDRHPGDPSVFLPVRAVCLPDGSRRCTTGPLATMHGKNHGGRRGLRRGMLQAKKQRCFDQPTCAAYTRRPSSIASGNGTGPDQARPPPDGRVCRREISSWISVSFLLFRGLDLKSGEGKGTCFHAS